MILLLVVQGLSDIPSSALGGQTPLALARMPSLRSILSQGAYGLVRTTIEGYISCRSAAIMALLGFNPSNNFPGNGILLSSLSGLKIDKDELVFELDLVRGERGTIKHWSTDINEKDASVLFNQLNTVWGNDLREIHHVIRDKGVLILKDDTDNSAIVSYPPWRASQENYMDLLYNIPLQDVRDLVIQSEAIITSTLTYALGYSRNREFPNMVWPWSPGRSTKPPEIDRKILIITQDPEIAGLAHFLRCDLIMSDKYTNKDLIDAISISMNSYDLLLLDIFNPAVYQRNKPQARVNFLEMIDRRIISHLLNLIDDNILVISGDITISSETGFPIEVPVPVVVFSRKMNSKNKITSTAESTFASGNLGLIPAWKLIDNIVSNQYD